MYGRSESATITQRLIPAAMVDSDWMPAGDRLELLLPRYSDSWTDRLLFRLASPEHRWVRYRLDYRASRLYDLIDGVRSVAELMVAYAERFPEDGSQLDARVLDLLQVFESHGFVEIRQV